MNAQMSMNEHPLAFDQFATWHWPYWSCCHGTPCCHMCENQCEEISRTVVQQEQEEWEDIVEDWKNDAAGG